MEKLNSELKVIIFIYYQITQLTSLRTRTWILLLLRLFWIHLLFAMYLVPIVILKIFIRSCLQLRFALRSCLVRFWGPSSIFCGVLFGRVVFECCQFRCNRRLVFGNQTVKKPSTSNFNNSKQKRSWMFKVFAPTIHLFATAFQIEFVKDHREKTQKTKFEGQSWINSRFPSIKNAKSVLFGVFP